MWLIRGLSCSKCQALTSHYVLITRTWSFKGHMSSFCKRTFPVYVYLFPQHWDHKQKTGADDSGAAGGVWRLVQQSYVSIQHQQRSSITHQGHWKPDHLPALPQLPTPLTCSGNSPSELWHLAGKPEKAGLLSPISPGGHSRAPHHIVVKRKA